MWHEARKQEKKLRVMIVDYRKRAERRREFYEKFKLDPTQFLQVHGRQCKIHVDPQVTAAADKCLMPWQGQNDNMIDRFDGRAHLDIILEASNRSADEGSGEENQEKEEAGLNYERYRILIQNDVAGISEDKFLHQIYVEEQFGTAAPHMKAMTAAASDSKPKQPKAAIAYNYGDSTAISTPAAKKGQDEEDSEEDIDFDLIVNVNDLTIAQTSELNQNATLYGMKPGTFMNFLNADVEEREQLKRAKQQEEQKQSMSGRKARRERRAYKDKIILRKGYISPPSYAAAADFPAQEAEDGDAHSSSGSESRASPEKITFITSFGGGESDGENGPSGTSGPSLASKLPQVSRKKWQRNRSPSNSPQRRTTKYREKGRGRSRSRSADRRRRSSRSYRRSRSRGSRSRRYHRSSSSSSSGGKHRRRSKSPKYGSSNYRSSHRRSRSTSRSRVRRRSRSDSLRRRRRSSSSSRGRRRSSSRGSDSPRPRGSRSRRSHRRSSSSSSRSSSRSRSRSRAKATNSVNKSKPSKDKEVKEVEPMSEEKVLPPPPPVRRYYGRHGIKDDEDSPLSLSSDNESDKETKNTSSDRPNNRSVHGHNHSHGSGHSGAQVTKSGLSTSSKASSTSTGLTPQERLKRRMQAALNKQLKADKEAERSRLDRLEQERLEREESLRELSIRYRRREREKRHQNRRSDSSSSDDDNSSHSRSRSSSSRSPSHSRSRRRGRSRSRSR